MMDYDTVPRNGKTARKLPKRASDAYALLKAEKDLNEDFCRDVEFPELKIYL